jgi:hypothetical protein
MIAFIERPTHAPTWHALSPSSFYLLVATNEEGKHGRGVARMRQNSFRGGEPPRATS